MSNISPIGFPNAATLGQVRSATPGPATPADASPRHRDQVELSATAKYLAKIADLPDVRQDVVDRVRSEIEAGTYESKEKLGAAIDALLNEEFDI